MKFWMTLTLMLLVAGAVNAADLHKARVAFEKGNAAYKEAAYDDAIRHYRGAIKEGWATGALHYNLANSYLKGGQLGRALVHYEKAAWLMPRDSDLEANRRFAANRINNYEPPRPPLWRRMLPHLDRLTLAEIRWITLVWFMLWVGLTAFAIGKPCPRQQITGWSLLLGVVFLFHAFAWTVKVIEARDRAIVVAVSEVKFEPLQHATTYYTLWEGWPVKVLKEENGWLKIRRPDGKEGWIREDAVERI
jgi:tetratricopeptide (TPR) repeat protein